jgi:type IV pilus assembly protein PilY1
MLHAVYDSEDDTHPDYGKELWAFIPPDQLARLKDIIEGPDHLPFVDSSPKAFINDVDEDGVIEAGDQVILICGLRGGGSSYFALDITDYNNPQLLWTIDPSQADFAELGETWSEPQFGVVETTADSDGVDVFFIGGGYSSDNTAGKAVFAVNVSTGALVKKFNTGMNYSFPSSVRVVDADNNGFVDKVYVGDHGGQMWRFGKFTDAGGDPLTFPDSDENIDNWTGQIIFDSTNARKFFYPPSVALEKEYDLMYMGTGDREDACNTTSSDRIYAVKDTHTSTTLTEADLVDVTDPAAPLPDIPGGDNGWYIRLAITGERVLAEGTLFYKTYYIPTFSPSEEPCLPGGIGKMYALNYLTAEAALSFGGAELIRSDEIGGGIPSKPVMIITDEGQKLLISVGSTNPEATSEETGAGIVIVDPLAPPINLFYLWWVEL